MSKKQLPNNGIAVEEFREVDPDDLKPNPNNPRKHPEKAIEKIKESIEYYGFTNPIIVDQDMRILAGHARLKAVRESGMESVPVAVTNLSGQDADAYMIADNRIQQETDWEEDTVSDLLETFGDGFDLSVTGFDELEIQSYLDPDIDDAEEDEAPPVPDEALTNDGDLWKLGDHRLLCGDATDEEDVEKLLNGSKIDLLLSDPPYGVSYSAKNEFLNEYDKGNRNQTPIEDDDLSVQEMKQLWNQSLGLAFQYAKPGGGYYVMGPQGGDLAKALMEAIDEAGWMLKHVLIWVKNNHVLGRSDYHYKHEPILYGWKDGAAHTYTGNGPNKSVWEIDKPLQSKEHPTMKPIQLFANAISNGSHASDIVYDPFLGSGTSIIAAEQLDRRCYGMEIDPHYCDVIIERWEEFTGEEAELIG